MQLGQEELIAKINASLARMMEDGTYDAILVKYVADDEVVEGEGEAAEDATAEDATAEN